MNSFDPRHCLERLLAGDSLGEHEAAAMLGALGNGEIEPALAGALLAALRAKGERAEEVRGFARRMRELAVRPDLPVAGAVDIVGTGGDGSGSLNLSTGVSLLTAACGVPVVKHGNRSVSSRSGSADVLAAINPRLPPTPALAAQCLADTDFTFLFAPHYHPAMATIAPVRQAMKVRTIFNVLGPLTNPAAPPYCVLGAYSVEMAQLMANALAGLDVQRGFVVHGEPGWDEATPCGPYHLFDVQHGQVTHQQRDPRDAGIARCTPADLAGGDADHNAARLRAALGGHADERAHIDALVLGCALALEVTGNVSSVGEGAERAREAITSGAARDWLAGLAAFGGAADDAVAGERGTDR